MFESSSKSRKSWNGWQMICQWIPDIWSNRCKWFGGCDGGFTWRNTYWQSWRRAECLRRDILWDERCKIGWLLKWEHCESNRSNLKLILWRTGSQCKSERTDAQAWKSLIVPIYYSWTIPHMFPGTSDLWQQLRAAWGQEIIPPVNNVFPIAAATALILLNPFPFRGLLILWKLPASPPLYR